MHHLLMHKQKYMKKNEQQESRFATKNELCSMELSTKPSLAAVEKGKRQTLLDPTTKASDMLIKALLEQKEHSLRQKDEKSRTSPTSRLPVFRSETKTHRKIPIKRRNDTSKKSKEEPNKKKIKLDLDAKIPELRLKPLEKHHVRKEFLDIEQTQDSKQIAKIKDTIVSSSDDCSSYIAAYKKMLYLEQAAEVLNVEKYNQRSIQLSYSNAGNVFVIKKTVSKMTFSFFKTKKL